MKLWQRRSKHPIAGLVGLLVIYYGLPISAHDPRALAFAVPATLLGVIVLAWAIVGQVNQHLRGDSGADVAGLILLLELVVVVFALSFYTLDRAAPDQIAGLSTRTDALYFTLSTVSTVGFGDIHAVDQLARGIVCIQLVFNLIFVAALGSTLAREVRARREQARRSGDVRNPDDTLAEQPPEVTG